MLHGCPRAAATSHPAVDRDHFQLGSLSHLLNAKAVGYQELPDWPDEAPDPSVRNVEVRGAPQGAGVHGGGVQGGGIISRSWESPRRCPGAAQLPHASSLVPTHLLGDRRGARAAVSAPHPWAMAPLHQPCASRFLSGPSAPAGRRGRRRWRNLSTPTQRASRDPRSQQTAVRTRWHGRAWGRGCCGGALGRGHCGRDIRQVPPQWDTLGDTAVGTSHHGGNVAGGYGDAVEGSRDAVGVVGTQRDAVGGWGDAVGRIRELWGCGG